MQLGPGVGVGAQGLVVGQGGSLGGSCLMKLFFSQVVNVEIWGTVWPYSEFWGSMRTTKKEPLPNQQTGNPTLPLNRPT